ncbi:glycosyltransferase family 2 protein [Bradyrhizobium cenepequi]|uniref:glycosyltransferase family 2 protein n=1 Tax=Bradyrhizobium cenepequi TaxID=2821403 RepID=UPI001CE390AC|nr:glycosyltransferase family 2 protein [Bradyrhizobium cenepequi]MCA6107135.1 glycosyltransferase family 2 protein [Bradyrhizobium cenepequi]
MSVKAACVMVVKNEDDLIEPWLFYHGELFGFEHLYVFDNGSTNSATLSVLERYSKRGVKLDYSRNTLEDHRSRSIWLGRFIKGLANDNYDFILPLDCDEFFALRDVDQAIRCDRLSILTELEELAGRHAIFQAYHSYPNLIGKVGVFMNWAQKKHFFSRRSFNTTDHGFHNVTGTEGAVFENTDFAYIHYHYKPFDIMVAHSKQKLSRDYDVSDISNIPATNRLGQFLHMAPEKYKDFVAQFKNHKKYSAPALQEILSKGGLKLPFSDYAIPD